jgi:hypothetical protein
MNIVTTSLVVLSGAMTLQTARLFESMRFEITIDPYIIPYAMYSFEVVPASRRHSAMSFVTVS